MNLICYLGSLLVAFFTRKAFLDQLGSEFIGLTSTLQSLLGFLNLAELGVGTAIGYVLYKPLFDNNQEKINQIISVFGYLYRWIGLFILGVGVVVSCFLPLIFPDTTFSWGVIYLGFYAYLFSSMLGYFVNYRQTLLSADQRNYEIAGYYQAVVSGKMLVQMALAYCTRSFVLFLTLEIVFGILYSCILTRRVNKVYPWLKTDIRQGRLLFKKYPEIGKYIKQLFVHKIGGFVQFQITPFLVYSYVSLPVVALYTNYTLITQKLQGFIVGILDSTSASVGNLISEGDREKIYATYKELISARFLISGILTACVFNLCNPFIANWLGTGYVLSALVTLQISLQFFMATTRGVTDQFLFGYGLFYDVWAPLAEATVFVASSMILGSLWGLPGVLCGPLLSTLLIIHVWKPYFLYTKGFKRPVFHYVALIAAYIAFLAVAYVGAKYLTDLILDSASMAVSWGRWLSGSLLFTCLMSVLATAIFWALSPGFRSLSHRFINLRLKKTA